MEFNTESEALNAVRINGFALEWVPNGLRTPELCMEAVRSSGWALQYVPAALQTTELCLAAVRRSPGAATILPATPATSPTRHVRAVARARLSGGSRLAGIPCRPHRRRPKHTQASILKQGSARCIQKYQKTPDILKNIINIEVNF